MPDGRLIRNSGGLAIGPQGGVVIAGSASQRCGCCGIAPCPGALFSASNLDHAFINLIINWQQVPGRLQISYIVSPLFGAGVSVFTFVGDCNQIVPNQNSCTWRAGGDGHNNEWGTGGQCVIEQACADLPTRASVNLTFSGIFIGCDCLLNQGLPPGQHFFLREINGANRAYVVPMSAQVGIERHFQTFPLPAIPIAARFEVYG